jgi:Na+/H+-dicarboxylate symporter
MQSFQNIAPDLPFGALIQGEPNILLSLLLGISLASLWKNSSAFVMILN